MISFVTLSRTPGNVARLDHSLHAANLAKLQQWELRDVDGSQYDLFRGYNFGASQARGEILAFVHGEFPQGKRCRPIEVYTDRAGPSNPRWRATHRR
jgi:hypothetical protein